MALSWGRTRNASPRWPAGSTRRRSTFDVDGKREQARALEREAAEPDFWSDSTNAQRLTTALSRLNDVLQRYDRLASQIGDLQAMDELLASENDPELSKELGDRLAAMEKELDRVELANLLSGEHDASDAVAVIHAGAGGIDAQDWAEMLLRMYLRWAEREGLAAEVDEILPGEEAGFKTATFTVSGPNAYGLLSAERGVHRLVRLSPFDQAHRRHTSFASLDVIPLLPETEEEDLDIDPKDLRIDVYRSSSAGGQSVNTTDSAVRITHLPTGITAACQNERSQLQNKAVAMRILKSRLSDLLRRAREEKLEDLRGKRMDIEFGSQIRSYVLQPYRLVKDHRTNLEVGNVDAVLDGDIDRLIEAELRRRATPEPE
jgi:peptide chain release factor 2